MSGVGDAIKNVSSFAINPIGNIAAAATGKLDNPVSNFMNGLTSPLSKITGTSNQMSMLNEALSKKNKPGTRTGTNAGYGSGSNGEMTYGDTYPQDTHNRNDKWGNLRDNVRNNTIGQTYNYLNRTADVNKRLVGDVENEAKQYGQNTNAASNRYMDAIQNYSNNYRKSLGDYQNRVGDYQNRIGDYGKSLEDYKNRIGDYQNSIGDYQKNASQYTGNVGYQNALNQAQRGAAQAASNAGALAQGNARSNGMSKGAAAALGSGNVINAYNQGLASQQNQVQNNYNNALNTLGNALGAQHNVLGAQGNVLSGHGNVLNAQNNVLNAQGNVLNGQGNIYGNMATAAGNMYSTDISSLNNQFSTMANTRNQAAGNMNNTLGQNVANYQNTFNSLYNNQDAIEKMFNGADSGIGGIGGNIVGGITNPLGGLTSVGNGGSTNGASLFPSLF